MSVRFPCLSHKSAIDTHGRPHIGGLIRVMLGSIVHCLCSLDLIGVGHLAQTSNGVAGAGGCAVAETSEPGAASWIVVKQMSVAASLHLSLFWQSKSVRPDRNSSHGSVGV
jgi:hypothetical protein